MTEDQSKNKLLDVLDIEEREQLRSLMEEITVRPEEVLWGQDEDLRFVYFPTTAAISLLLMTQDGRSVDIGGIGNEGMVGICPLLGRRKSIAQAVSQLPGKAYRIPIDPLEALLERNKEWKRKLLQYAYAVVTQIAWSAACHALHSVAARSARWLLSLNDYAKHSEFPLRREVLADKLGVSRQTIGITLESFERARLVRTGRGKVTVIDEDGLQAQACECYTRIKDELSRVSSE